MKPPSGGPCRALTAPTATPWSGRCSRASIPKAPRLDALSRLLTRWATGVSDGSEGPSGTLGAGASPTGGGRPQPPAAGGRSAKALRRKEEALCSRWPIQPKLPPGRVGSSPTPVEAIPSGGAPASSPAGVGQQALG